MRFRQKMQSLMPLSSISSAAKLIRVRKNAPRCRDGPGGWDCEPPPSPLPVDGTGQAISPDARVLRPVAAQVRLSRTGAAADRVSFSRLGSSRRTSPRTCCQNQSQGGSLSFPR
jgi:hypothetical protein